MPDEVPAVGDVFPITRVGGEQDQPFCRLIHLRHDSFTQKERESNLVVKDLIDKLFLVSDVLGATVYSSRLIYVSIPLSF